MKNELQVQKLMRCESVGCVCVCVCVVLWGKYGGGRTEEFPEDRVTAGQCR